MSGIQARVPQYSTSNTSRCPKDIKAQITAIIPNAGISLSIFKLCSKVIARYPNTKTIMTSDSIYFILMAKYNNLS